MALDQCPTCAGEGFVATGGTYGVSWYIANGFLRKAWSRAHQKPVLVPTKKLHQESHSLPEAAAEFKDCWCNHPIMHLSEREDAPLYWNDDLTGQSQKIVLKCWEDEDLNVGDIHYLRAYIAQWVLGVQKQATDRNPEHVNLSFDEWLPRVAEACTKEDFLALNDYLEQFGLDPF